MLRIPSLAENYQIAKYYEITIPRVLTTVGGANHHLAITDTLVPHRILGMQRSNLNRLGDELRAVVASHICRWASKDEQVGQGIDHVGRVQRPINPDGQALPTDMNYWISIKCVTMYLTLL